MKLLHVTHAKNIKSIFKHGLIPTFIDIDSHWEVFKKHLNNRKCIYLWNAETYKNDKFIRDMIFTKLFIHPRNKLFTEREAQIEKHSNDIEDYDQFINFHKFGDKLFGLDGQYFLLEIDYFDVDTFGSWNHVQTPGNNKISTTVIMDDFYAHDDKEIFISPNVIKPKHLKIVEEIHVRKTRDKKLNFSFGHYL